MRKWVPALMCIFFLTPLATVAARNVDEPKADLVLQCRGVAVDPDTGSTKLVGFEIEFFWETGSGRLYYRNPQGILSLNEEKFVSRDSNKVYFGEASIDRKSGIFKNKDMMRHPDKPDRIICNPIEAIEEGNKF